MHRELPVVEGVRTAEVAADFAGPVIVGEYLMTIDLAKRTVAWRGAVLGLGWG